MATYFSFEAIFVRVTYTPENTVNNNIHHLKLQVIIFMEIPTTNTKKFGLLRVNEMLKLPFYNIFKLSFSTPQSKWFHKLTSNSLLILPPVTKSGMIADTDSQN